MDAKLPADWKEALGEEMAAPYFQELADFVDGERRQHTVFPAEDNVFLALRLTPLAEVKVVLLGQDPYHNDGQAHGLCFSVPPGVKMPPSLVNIFKELKSDLGCKVPTGGCLESWARQGVLLLNVVLTVRAHEPHSHKRRGWERFTDSVIRAVAGRPRPAVFALWGNHAQQKEKLVDASRHRIVAAAHPSPLSARLFFGSRPFSKVNMALEELGYTPINWCADS
jgi:uracil-DNA glycosylase